MVLLSGRGTLSLTDSERESGYSVSSLFAKYRTQLVGYYWAEVFGKEFPLQFSFNQMDDAASSVPSWWMRTDSTTAAMCSPSVWMAPRPLT